MWQHVVFRNVATRGMAKDYTLSVKFTGSSQNCYLSILQGVRCQGNQILKRHLNLHSRTLYRVTVYKFVKLTTVLVALLQRLKQQNECHKNSPELRTYILYNKHQAVEYETSLLLTTWKMYDVNIVTQV